MKLSELLNSPDKWAQGAWAYTKEGTVCHAESEHAICWCLRGAVRKTQPHTNTFVVEDCLRIAIEEEFPKRVKEIFDDWEAADGDKDYLNIVAIFNDHQQTTFADIQRVLVKAEALYDERLKQ